MSNSISQKEAVVNEVNSILGSSFDSNRPAKDQLTSDQIASIKSNIINGIVNGSISYTKEVSDVKEVSRYVSGMVSNHFRKAKELNGNVDYSPQSTGRGSRDSQISELNKLLKTFDEGSSEYEEVVEAIAVRRTELAEMKATQLKEKRKAKEIASIDTNALPEHLQGLANSLVSES